MNKIVSVKTKDKYFHRLLHKIGTINIQFYLYEFSIRTYLLHL